MEPSPSVDGKKQVRGPSGEYEPGPRHAAEHSLRQACVRGSCRVPASVSWAAVTTPHPGREWVFKHRLSCLVVMHGNTRLPELPPETPVCRAKATIRTGHGTTDGLKIGKELCEGSIVSPCLFDFCTEFNVMRNAGPEESQAEIKSSGTNMNNLRHADDTTLMAESEEELKSLLLRVMEESEKVGLKLNIQKTKIMASGPIISWQVDGETVETGTDCVCLGSTITVDSGSSLKLKDACSLEEKLT